MAGDRLQVGNVEIITLTDLECRMAFTLPQLFAGVPLSEWAPYQKRYPSAFEGEDGWHVHVGGTLIRSGGRTILVDTGLGPDPNPMLGSGPGRLLEAMHEHGIAPGDIDIVFATHAHLDHIGWNLTREGKPTFPNARYVMHEADWNGREQLQEVILAFGGERYLDRTLTGLDTLGVLDLLSGESALTPEVTALPTPGHTAGSMSVLVSSGGEKAIITGDVMTNPAIVTETGWQFGFDMDASLNTRTRDALLDRIEADDITLATCHFPHPGFGKIIRIEGRRYWEALP